MLRLQARALCRTKAAPASWTRSNSTAGRRPAPPRMRLQPNTESRLDPCIDTCSLPILLQLARLCVSRSRIPRRRRSVLLVPGAQSPVTVLRRVRVPQGGANLPCPPLEAPPRLIVASHPAAHQTASPLGPLPWFCPCLPGTTTHLLDHHGNTPASYQRLPTPPALLRPPLPAGRRESGCCCNAALYPSSHPFQPSGSAHSTKATPGAIATAPARGSCRRAPTRCRRAQHTHCPPYRKSTAARCLPCLHSRRSTPL